MWVSRPLLTALILSVGCGLCTEAGFTCRVMTIGHMFNSSYALGHSCGVYGPCVNLGDRCRGEEDGCVDAEQCPPEFGGIRVERVRDFAEADSAHVVFSNSIDELIPPWSMVEGQERRPLRVIVAGEPVTKYADWMHTHYLGNVHSNFDISIGYSPRLFDLHMNFMPPSAQVLWERRPVPRAQKERRIAAMVSSPHSENSRQEVLRMIMERTPGVESFGAFMNNAKVDPALEMDHGLTWSAAGDYRRTAMVETLRDFRFFLAFENTCEADYVSEKILIALEAGTIPVYFGAPNIMDYWPYPNSFIDVRDFPTVQALVDYIDHVDSNETLYESYFWWKNEPVPMELEARAALRSYRWNVCRACQEYSVHHLVREVQATELRARTVEVTITLSTDFAGGGIQDSRQVNFVSRIDESSFGAAVRQCKRAGSGICNARVVREFGGSLQAKKNMLIRWARGQPYRTLEDLQPRPPRYGDDDDVILEAEMFMRAGRYQEAASSFTYALEHREALGLTEADCLHAKHGQGAAAMMMGFPETALEMLKEAASGYDGLRSLLVPSRAPSYHVLVDLAIVQGLLGHTSDSLANLRLVSEHVDPNDAAVWFLIGWVLEMENGNMITEAKEAYETAASLDAQYLDIPLGHQDLNQYAMGHRRMAAWQPGDLTVPST